MRVSYAVSDSFTAFGGVNNGWDDLKDTNSAKTVEIGASWTPIKPLSIAAVNYMGNERVGGLVATGA